jgi:hypothetical protein
MPFRAHTAFEEITTESGVTELALLRIRIAKKRERSRRFYPMNAGTGTATISISLAVNLLVYFRA